MLVPLALLAISVVGFGVVGFVVLSLDKSVSRTLASLAFFVVIASAGALLFGVIHGILAVGPSGQLETRWAVVSQLVGMAVAGTVIGWLGVRFLGKWVLGRRHPRSTGSGPNAGAV
jgi:hypothetical protein